MDAIALGLLAVSALTFSLGTGRVFAWILDRRDVAILRQLREEDLIATAEREHARALAEYFDPIAAAAEERADRLNDATMCEAEWSR